MRPSDLRRKWDIPQTIGVCNKARNKAIKRLIGLQLEREKIVLWILVSAVVYALISNFLTLVSPLHTTSCIWNFLASCDETMRNCCYGVIAGISFYLINDFYKNIYKKVDSYNEMYPSLFELWWNLRSLIISINDYKIDRNMSNEELKTSIITYLSHESGEEQLSRRFREIPAQKYQLLCDLWDEASKNKMKFLETYGHIITREEYAKLNDRELDISVDRLNQYTLDDKIILRETKIIISERDIQRAIYLIVRYKTDLALMVNKYSNYYYGYQKGLKQEAF